MYFLGDFWSWAYTAEPQLGVFKMFENETKDEVPIRCHYLIQDGELDLPVAESLEIIQRKREMQAALRLLQNLYVRLLCRNQLGLAELVLSGYRGLEELRFVELFDQFGFPDELGLDC